MKATITRSNVIKTPSCQTHPVCCWACVHLFQLARTFAPLSMQHAFKFSTQTVWDIAVQLTPSNDSRRSHAARSFFKVARFKRSTRQTRRPARTQKDHSVHGRRQRGRLHINKDSVRLPHSLSPSEATWQVFAGERVRLGAGERLFPAR